MKRMIQVFCMLMLMTILVACGTADSDLGEESKETASLKKSHSVKAEGNQIVHVDMANADGDKIGVATLEQAEDGVRVQIEAADLPKGTHGFHIHEKGACDAPSFESAGGHFNPTDAKHGFDNPDGPHAGDLANLEVGADGKVTESFLAEMVTLKKNEPNSLLREGGTALVIHADADDNISQPAGNSGTRIACGVVRE